MTETSHLFSVDSLRAMVRDVVAGFGSSDAECHLVADNLVQANLTGHDSHGVGMLPRYVRAYQEGSLQPNQQVAIRQDHGMLLALDGQMGFGQAIGHQAMLLGIDRARQHGVCVMALANAHHLGRIGHWAEMAVAEGFVSIHFVNVIARPIVAPWGGSDARLGTNPCAIGIPLSSGEPFILDLATSVIAQGKTRVAYNKGEALKPGYLLDKQGQPTTDPAYGVMPPFGALLPFGEHKGFGLSLACELLGGALAGGLAVSGPADGKWRVLNSMLTVLIDPERVGSRAVFDEQAHQALAWVKASPPQPGVGEVLVAGDPERRARTERSRNGILVDTQTWRDIVDTAQRLGVTPEQLLRHVTA